MKPIWTYNSAKPCESFNDVETSPSGTPWLKNNDNNMLFTVVPMGHIIGIPCE